MIKVNLDELMFGISLAWIDQNEITTWAKTLEETFNYEWGGGAEVDKDEVLACVTHMPFLFESEVLRYLADPVAFIKNPLRASQNSGDTIVCPHCYHDDSDDRYYGEGSWSVSCGHCGKDYVMIVHVSYSYETQRENKDGL